MVATSSVPFFLRLIQNRRAGARLSGIPVASFEDSFGTKTAPVVNRFNGVRCHLEQYVESATPIWRYAAEESPSDISRAAIDRGFGEISGYQCPMSRINTWPDFSFPPEGKELFRSLCPTREHSRKRCIFLNSRDKQPYRMASSFHVAAFRGRSFSGPYPSAGFSRSSSGQVSVRFNSRMRRIEAE